MGKDRAIDYIEFPASHLGEIKTFYGEVFGWSFQDYGADYTSFHDGRLYGGFRRADPAEDTVRGGVLVVLFADDLEAARQRVIDAGGRIETEIFEFPGGRRFHFLDPAGNELAVWSDS